MKLQYLGTAACEGIPSPFCDCDICREARRLGGREIRSRSQALVDGKILIDLNADTFYHTILYGVDLLKVRHCFVTHVHTDHFYQDELRPIRYAVLPAGCPPFVVHGSEDVLDKMQNALSVNSDKNLRYEPVEPFVPVTVEGITVTALPAAHGTPHPYIYIFSDGKKSMLYGNDTGMFPDATWDYLKKIGVRFDLVSLDCTEGAMDDLPYFEHQCLGRNVKTREIMLECGMADVDTVFVSQHFSHSGKDVLYRDYAPVAEKAGILTAYDGMEIEF